jgi:HTH-type transcriptional regulator/antitoxin HigA
MKGGEMALLNNIKPAKNIGPGEHIQELMQLRDWTQQDLGDVLGVSTKHANKLLNNEQPITLNMAKLLGEAFDLTPEFWVSLDTKYRLRLEEETETERDVDIRSKIYQHMPINEMARKGWFKKPKDTDELEELVCDFFKTDTFNLETLSSPLELAFKKSDAFENFNQYAAKSWFQMAKNCSEEQSVPKYDKKKLKNFASSLHGFTKHKNGVAKAIEILNETGVKFIVLTHLQKTYIDGASFIHNGSPVVVYTARYKRNDNFWFTLAHEIAHILKHLKEEGKPILDNFSDKDESYIEKEANDLAGKYLKHDKIFEYFKNDLSYITQEQVEECSDKYKIHTAIIMGALAFKKVISYKYLHMFTEDVRSKIPIDFYAEPNVQIS